MATLGNVLLGALLGHTDAEKMFRQVSFRFSFRFSFRISLRVSFRCCLGFSCSLANQVVSIRVGSIAVGVAIDSTVDQKRISLWVSLRCWGCQAESDKCQKYKLEEYKICVNL